MKTLALLLLLACFGTGCATSTIESRRQERLALYSKLPPEQQALVNSGQIKVGMSMDAVYIAWGQPSQILAGESSQGRTTTWLYHGTYLEEYRYWNYGGYGYRSGYYGYPTITHDYFPRGYVSAEVRFENGVVKEWRSLPQPAP